MANKLTPVEFDLIEQGQLKQDANSAMLKLQEILIKHVRQYKDAAKGATAKMTIEIGFVCVDPKPNEETFGVVSKIKTSLPAAPAYTSILLPGTNMNGTDCLECRVSGSSSDTPKQGLLCTEDGQAIDLETGEVKDNC